jgi:polar amino acid transport system substrate-binding protein
MFKRVWIGLVASLAAVTFAIAQVPTQVVIAAEDDWYPYGGKINGVAAGLGVDLVKASFAAVGITVRFESVPYTRCLDMVKSGKVLACNEPARTQETESSVLWPTKPLFSARSVIYARQPSKETGLSSASLEGKRVMVTNGFEYGSEFDTNKKVIREVATKEISVFRMLAAKRGDYALAYEKVANHIFRQNAREFEGKFVAVGMVSEIRVYCGFSKTFPDSQRYLDLFNQGFAIIQKNGQYQESERRWQ